MDHLQSCSPASDASIQTLMSLGADARTTSQPRPYPCCHRPRTRYRLPADDGNPHKHQVRAYTSTNITQARPPPGDQRPHGGDGIDRSSRTSPSASHATTHGGNVDVSHIRTRPTTASLTSPCSSSDPRGQRCRDRRGDQLARRMSERDEVGVTASLLRWRGRRAASLLALEAVCLARPTTPATHHRQRCRSCIAVPRGGGQDSATSAASEASAAARGPHGPSAVRRSGAVERWMGATGRLGGGRWREKSASARPCERVLARAWPGPLN